MGSGGITMRQAIKVVGIFTALVASIAIIATTAAQQPAAPARSARAFPAVENQQLLQNAHVVTEKVIAGAQPEGDASFAALRDLGVKTIISVDGAAPDVATAKKFGLRYIHLPIGYDGVQPAEGKAIAKAITEMPGKIYVHCHHGKHRSAAAVAVACVYNGTLDPSRSQLVLQTFGTGVNYKGLWKDALAARPLDPAELRDFEVSFVETAKIGDLADSMVKIDTHFDHIKLIQSGGWKIPSNHPDLDPVHETLQVEEHFREAARLQSMAERPEKFRTMLAEGEIAAQKLGAILGGSTVYRTRADAAFERISISCANCHKSFRD
jgi:protein tyrosine phosphatase (PTP) superfamily phosphohydrolase (DUF442 family)